MTDIQTYPKPMRFFSEPYRMFIKGLGCQLRHISGHCFGVIDPHHTIDKSIGGDDMSVIGACRSHHIAVTDKTKAQLAKLGTSKAQMLDIAANNWKKYGGDYGQKST